MIKINRQLKAAEPLTLSEVKNWLKVDGDADDMTITAMISQVRELVESYLGRCIANTTVTLQVSASVYVEPPYGPVDTIVSVKDADGNDVSYTWDGFTLNFSSPVISVTAGTPQNTVKTIVYESAGGSIPEGLKLGLLEVIAWLYESRGDEDKLTYMIYQNANLQVYRQKIWFT